MTLTGALQGQVPIKCKRLFPNYEHHRQDLKDSVRRQLEKDGKRLLKLRVLADGWVADWEEIGGSQNNCTSGLHQVTISAIGTKLEPVDLTLWDGEREFKQEVQGVQFKQDVEFKQDGKPLKSEPVDESPLARPRGPHDASRDLPRRHPSHDIHIDPVNHRRGDVSLPEEEDDPLHPPHPSTPTAPRNNKLNPDTRHPYIPRRSLAEPYFASNHRYIRSDRPGSLQLHRLTPSKPAARGVHRTRLTSLRGRPERRGYRQEQDRSPRNEEHRRTFRREQEERRERGWHEGNAGGCDRREDTRLTRTGREERRGYRENNDRGFGRHEARRHEDGLHRPSGRKYTERPRATRVALENQHGVYRRTLGRGRGWRGTEWPDTDTPPNVGSTSTGRPEQSMQVDAPRQSQLELADHSMVLPFNSGGGGGDVEMLFIAERPTSPDMNHDMLEGDHPMKESVVPDTRDNPPSDISMKVKTSRLSKEPSGEDDELVSSPSSSSEDEGTKPHPTQTRAPKSQQKAKGTGAADLLASINLASVKDMLHESTPAAPTPRQIARSEPQVFRRLVDGKPPIIRTAKPPRSTSSQIPPRPRAFEDLWTERNAKSSGLGIRRAYVNPDPESDSDSSQDVKADLNPEAKVDAKAKTKIKMKDKVREKDKAPPRLSMQYRHAETVKLPKPDYARARRLLAPLNNPLACVSMPGDVQFVRDDERVRVEAWSLPAPARPKSGDGKKAAYVVTDACLLGDENVVMVHETGPHPASIVHIPDDYDDVPVRHDLSHVLVPASSIQRRGVLSSVCALDSERFFTGCMDKRVLLWDIRDLDNGAPKASLEALDITHAASVRALAYSSSRNWLISAAGAKLAVTDVLTGQAVLKAGKQKWASNDVFNVHFHSRDPNILLVETGDLDKQARIYDLRKLQKPELAPERLIGSTETGAVSQYVRGDWAKSLVVRPSSLNLVKVWDTRQPDRPLSVHTLSHTVTHCIFIDDCRTIAVTGEHFVTFLDARV